MIKLVLPMCKKHFPLANILAQRFVKFADMKDRSLLVTVAWEDHFPIPDFCKFLTPHFADVQFHVLPDIPEFGGWPEAGNHMFFHTAEFLFQSGNKDPWYFFEPDNTPLYPHWMAAFDHEYTEASKPYMGVMNVSRKRTPEGKVEVDGRHMVGTGIYPADLFTRSSALHVLEHEPWDVAMQDEIVPEAHETNLIFHAWNTGRYKKDADGFITGEDFGPNKGRYGGRPVPIEAVVVHGCKDDSLSKIDFGPRRVTL